MYYYLYKITNKETGQLYIGVHKTKNIDDGYMGSGRLLRRSIEKYGKENFRKEIIEFFENEDEMFKKEKEVVNEEFVGRKDTYNIATGGNGGWYHINFDAETKANAVSKAVTTTKNWDKEKKQKNKELKSMRVSGDKNYFYGSKREGPENPMFGRTHTKGAKKKISDANKNKAIVITEEGKTKRIDINDESYKNGNYNSINSGYVIVKDKEGNFLRVNTDDHRYRSGEFIHSNCGRTHSDETRDIIRQKVKETKWYNNGAKSIRSKNHPGDGWVEGRLPFAKLPPKKWFTNGVDNKLVRHAPDDTWYEGKTKIKKIWVTNKVQELLIREEYLKEFIENGWFPGRR